MKRALAISGLLVVILHLSVASSEAKPWTLKETNIDPDDPALIVVRWTIKDQVVKIETPVTLQPGESKEFKPPKNVKGTDPATGKEINLGNATDWIQTTTIDTPGNPKTTTVKGLVLKESNSFKVGDIADVVDPFDIGTEFLIPDPFIDGGTLFVGIDLAVYLPAAVSSIPSSLEIANGVSATLPGYLIGTTEVTFDSALGLTTDSPFTGTVLFDASHAITVVPGPPASMLLCAGLVAFIGLRTLNRRAVRHGVRPTRDHGMPPREFGDG